MDHKTFGSDNYAPVHPKVFQAMLEANRGDAAPYGEDKYTAQAIGLLHNDSLLGPDCDIRFVLNGTGANVLALSAIVKPWESVICAASAHINNDEVGAPEHISGIKLVTVDTEDGKLRPDLIEPHLAVLGFEHARQPGVISISNSTEYGTIYSPEELEELCSYAHSRGLLVHCDGARLANAVAAQDARGVTLYDLTAGAGVDALSLGGTKNGMVSGEAIALFGEARNRGIFMLRKMNLQLASKMRYIAAQYIGMFSDRTWLDCALQANNMAKRLSKGLADIGVFLTRATEANEVFALLPPESIKPLQERFGFYDWDTSIGEVRFVTSWDTMEEDVDALLEAIKKEIL